MILEYLFNPSAFVQIDKLLHLLVEFGDKTTVTFNKVVSIFAIILPPARSGVG